MGSYMGGFMRGYMGGDSRRLARKGYRQPIGRDLKLRWRYAVLQASVVNSTDATADLLDQLHAVEQIKKQRVPGDAPAAQVFFSHSGGKPPRRYDLDPVLEDVNLYVGRAAIVTVSDGIYHSLP